MLDILFLIIFLVFYVALNPEWSVPSTRPAGRIFIALLAHVLITISIALTAGLLALIPWPRQPYLHRAVLDFSWLLAIALLLMDIVYGQRILVHWNKRDFYKLQTVGELDDILGTADSDCERVRSGTFNTQGILIERSGAHQTHRWPKGAIETFTVRWTSECTYELDPLDTTDRITSVKVINVTDDWYDCVLVSNKACRLVRMHFGRP